MNNLPNKLIRTPFWQFSITNKYNIKIASLYFILPFLFILGFFQYKYPQIFQKDKNILLIIFIIFGIFCAVFLLPKSNYYTDARSKNSNGKPNPSFCFLEVHDDIVIINDPKIGFFKFKKEFKLSDVSFELKHDIAILRAKNVNITYDLNHLAYEDGKLLSGLEWPNTNKEADLKNENWSNINSPLKEHIVQKQKEAKKLFLSLVWPF